MQFKQIINSEDTLAYGGKVVLLAKGKILFSMSTQGYINLKDTSVSTVVDRLKLLDVSLKHQTTLYETLTGLLSVADLAPFIDVREAGSMDNSSPIYHIPDAHFFTKQDFDGLSVMNGVNN